MFRDAKVRGQDETETLNSQDRDETETFIFKVRDRDETDKLKTS